LRAKTAPSITVDDELPLPTPIPTTFSRFPGRLRHLLSHRRTASSDMYLLG
jgi:hypothetical protein